MAGDHAFLRDATGTITKFDAPHAGKGNDQGTVAYRIDDAGVVCGAFFDPATVGHGLCVLLTARSPFLTLRAPEPALDKAPMHSRSIMVAQSPDT